MTTKLDYVHCMLIPLREHYLLLPNAVIAEVIPMPRQMIAAHALSQNPLVGDCHWRDIVLPVIDLENMIGEVASADSRSASKLCIVNGINPASKVDHYAMSCCGAPQLITLNQAALQTMPLNQPKNGLLCQIKIGNKSALIPHLDEIEGYLQNHLAIL